MKSHVPWTVVFLLCWIGGGWGGSAWADSIRDAMKKGVLYLAKRQNPDGGYGPQTHVEGVSEVGITAMVLYAFAVHPDLLRSVDGPFVSRAVKFLLSKQQANGAFYDPLDPMLENYRTCVVVLALTSLDPVTYADPIRKAREFIKSGQLDESVDYSKDEHVSYGAFAYGSVLRGDLSNSTMAAEALTAAGISGSDALWKKFQVFLENCQNGPDVSPLLQREGIGTSNDGGFRYAPNTTRGQTLQRDGTRVFSSYGSMTYQGLKGLLLAQVPKSDPRVARTIRWIADNFTVEHNPGIGSSADPKSRYQGLYYYYHAMARALFVYGEREITDSNGKKHVWARELGDHVASLQRADGSWLNATGRWWEDIPELDTAYALITLSSCNNALASAAGSGNPAPKTDPSAGANRVTPEPRH